MLEFAAQSSNVPTLALFSSKRRDVVSRRARVMDGGSSETYQSIMCAADSATGWVHIVPTQSRSADLDRLVDLATELHGHGKR